MPLPGVGSRQAPTRTYTYYITYILQPTGTNARDAGPRQPYTTLCGSARYRTQNTMRERWEALLSSLALDDQLKLIQRVEKMARASEAWTRGPDH